MENSYVFQMFNNHYNTNKAPEDLAGISKKSFALPYNGGEIWFEHLDGMYQYTEHVLDKLNDDSSAFLRPSSTSFIAFVLFETQMSQEIVDAILKSIFNRKKAFKKICFVGLTTKWKRAIQKSSNNLGAVQIAFIDDLEKAKQWLLP